MCNCMSSLRLLLWMPPLTLMVMTFTRLTIYLELWVLQFLCCIHYYFCFHDLVNVFFMFVSVFNNVRGEVG